MHIHQIRQPLVSLQAENYFIILVDFSEREWAVYKL